MAHLPGLIVVVVWHTLAIYLFLIGGLSRIGRSLIAERTLPTYLTIALLGSAVETGLYAGSGSLVAGLASATTLLVANRVLTVLLTRSVVLRHFLIGTPIVLVHDGQLVWPHLRQVGMNEQDLLAAIRERGYEQLDDVRFAVMEVNGSVGVIPQTAR
jgi:uncharacterized membrane protein YcaP (DUF421 family)